MYRAQQNLTIYEMAGIWNVKRLDEKMLEHASMVWPQIKATEICKVYVDENEIFTQFK